MISLLFLSSGLFLGWMLGSNNLSNIFGTAIGYKMIKFKIAAIVAGIFVVIGAIVQGKGGAETINHLGAVNAIGGAFTISLCAGLTIILLSHYRLPASATQAIVGSILGWCFFSKTEVDLQTLGTIMTSWITAPLLGAVIAPILYILLRFILGKTRLHIIKLDSYIRIVLVAVGIFGAYSLGANNLANVTGIFLTTLPIIQFNLGLVTIGSIQLLYFLGGLSIAGGIYWSGRKKTVNSGIGIMELTPEAAIVVVMSQALILFTFSSPFLSRLLHTLGLPEIPQVPVSPSQIVVGSMLGISLLKGVGAVNFKLLKLLITGWILTPIIAFLSTFFSLFVIQNVFKIVVSKVANTFDSNITANQLLDKETFSIPVSSNLTMIVLALTLLCIVSLVVFLQIRKHQLRIINQKEKRSEESQYNEMHKALTDIEVKTVQLENSALASRLQEKRNEVVSFALNIGEQRKYLDMLSERIEKAYWEEDATLRNEILKEVLTSLHQKMSFSNEMDDLYLKAEKVHNDFPNKINERFPELTEQEKRLTILLRVGFSSKEISSIMNISPKGVEISRYRLRKKLNIDNKVNLTNFIKSI